MILAGGIVISNAMARYLVRRLDDFPERELEFVLDYLNVYYASQGRASDEMKLSIMNALDPCLESPSGQIFLEAAKLFYVAAIENLDLSQEQEDITNNLIEVREKKFDIKSFKSIVKEIYHKHHLLILSLILSDVVLRDFSARQAKRLQAKKC